MTSSQYGPYGQGYTYYNAWHRGQRDRKVEQIP